MQQARGWPGRTHTRPAFSHTFLALPPHPSLSPTLQPPASSLRASRRYTTMRNKGRTGERFGESSTRALVADAEHPGAYNLLGDRGLDAAAAPGIVPVPFADLLNGPLGAPWPGVKFGAEFYRAGYGSPRGPSLEHLAVDPGPQYAITAASPNVKGVGERGAIVAPTLLGITRTFAEMAGDAGGPSSSSSSSSAASAERLGTSYRLGAASLRGHAADLAYATLHPHLGASAAPIAAAPAQEGGAGEGGAAGWGATAGTGAYVAAGAYRGGTQLMTTSVTAQGLSTSVDPGRYDLGKSAGQQFFGGRAPPDHAAVDVTSVGRDNAVVTARADVYNAGLLGRTRPGSGAPTLAGEGVSGGVVFDDGAAGLAGGRAARIHTVLHPLDAFATTRMLVAQEKAGQIEAERFRKSIVGAVVRRDTIAATSHPHGALGVDSVDNEASAVYGELAARRRLERERAFMAAAAREARILAHQHSEARRGYDFLRPDAAPALHGHSARLDLTGAAPADRAAAQRDGLKVRKGKRGNRGGRLAVTCAAPTFQLALSRSTHAFPPPSTPQFLEDKVHAPDPLARRDASMRTSRVLLGESLPRAAPARTQQLVNNTTNGRSFNILTGKVLPDLIRPTMDERKGNARHAHPSMADVINPLGR